MFGLEKIFGTKKQEIKAVEAKRNTRSYAAAAYNRLVSDWIASITTANAEIKSSLNALRARSRQLARDNTYFVNFLRELDVNVVERGIRFQAQVRKQRGGDLDTSINDLIESEFEKWTKKDSATTEGINSFYQIQKLLVREVAEAGECFVRFIYQPFGKSKVPFCLELIEAENLDINFNGKYGSNDVKMGVELNSWGRPVAYHFYGPNYQQDVIAQSKNRIRILAEDILHLMVPTRLKQNRGIPWAHAAILETHHLGGYKESELIGARAFSALMGFIESDEGETIGDDEDEYDRVKDFAPGTFAYLAPGEKVQIPNSTKPISNFDPFSKFILRSIASGLGISFQSLTKDYSEGSYSSTRQALLSDRDNWRVIQAWFMDSFCQPVLEKWTERAVLSGVLKLNQYELNPEKYTAVKWLPRGWAWIDPTKEIDAFKEALKSGLTSKQEIIGQAGGDFEETTLQIKREREFEKKNDLKFDLEPIEKSYPQPNPKVDEPTNNKED